MFNTASACYLYIALYNMTKCFLSIQYKRKTPGWNVKNYKHSSELHLAHVLASDVCTTIVIGCNWVHSEDNTLHRLPTTLDRRKPSSTHTAAETTMSFIVGFRWLSFHVWCLPLGLQYTIRLNITMYMDTVLWPLYIHTCTDWTLVRWVE